MAEYYLTIKSIHMSTALLSISLFGLRYVLMLLDSAHLRARWLRILPHIIDTVLLLSAIALAVTLRQYPFVHPWLTAKVLALVLYILLGTVALKRGRTRRVRAVAGGLAVATFIYIVRVATTKQILPI